MSNNRQELLNNGVAVGPQGEGRDSPSTFPTYPAYKDSGVEWLGEVPDHWESRRLKFLFSLQKRPVVDGDGIVTCFRDGAVTLRSNRRTDGFTNAEKEIGYQGIRKGDLVIHAMDAFAGAIGVSDSDGKSSPVYSACTPNEGVSAYYFARLLRHMALAGFVSSLAKGIRERSTDFRWSDASEICLPLPSISEQTQIARFLDHETARIDALIEEQQRLIELLKEKRQAVISHAVTKGLDPTVPMKDSGVEWLGQVPAHWVRKRLKNISPFITVGIVVNPSDYVADEGLPFIYGGEVKEGFIEVYKARKISPEHSRKNRKTMLEAGDIVTMRVGYPGLTAVVPPECAGGNCASVMLVKRGDYDSHWLCAVMNSRLVRQQVEVVQYGAAQKQFNIADAIEFWMFEPPIEEQAMIAEFIGRQSSVFNALMEQSERSMLLLQERRSALISAAVTGKIDVRSWQPPAENPASIAHTIQ